MTSPSQKSAAPLGDILDREAQITQDREDPQIPVFPDAWRLAIAALGPDDVLVVSVPGLLSKAHQEIIMSRFKGVFPGHKVLILSDGITLSIVAPEPTS